MSAPAPVAGIGVLVAANIARHLTRLGWDLERLAVEVGEYGPTAHELDAWRTDAGLMPVVDLCRVALALGVLPSVLVREVDL